MGEIWSILEELVGSLVFDLIIWYIFCVKFARTDSAF